MTEKVSIPTVANQFMRVEGELSTLKGLAQQFADHLTQAVAKDEGCSMVLTMRGFHVTIHELELRWGPADDSPPPTDEDVPVGKPVDQPPTEAPEPRAPLAGKPVHFDGHHWRKGPSPEPSDADKPVGQG